MKNRTLRLLIEKQLEKMAILRGESKNYENYISRTNSILRLSNSLYDIATDLNPSTKTTSEFENHQLRKEFKDTIVSLSAHLESLWISLK